MRLAGFFLGLSCTVLRAQAPIIQLQYPEANQTDVARNAAIFLRLTLTDGTSPMITLRQTGTTTNLSFGAVSSSTDPQKYELTLTPFPQLLANTSYTVTISQGGSTQFSFTTGAGIDTTPPHVVSVTPDPASGTADTWGPFTLRFDKLLGFNTGGVDASDGGGRAIGSVTQNMLPDRRTVTVRISPNYRVPLIVKLLVTARDLIGNYPSTPDVITFQTALGRNQPGPKVVAISPANGATEAPTNSAVQVLFDRGMLESSLRQGILLESQGQAIAATPRLAGTNVAVISGVTLLPSTKYRVRVTSEVRDADGFSLSEESQYEFTTAPLPLPDPLVQTVTGPGFSATPPTNTQIVVRSARPMPAFAPSLISTVTTPTSGTYDVQQFAASATLSADGRTLVVTPRDPFPPHARIGANFTSLTDITGRDLGQSVVFTTAGGPDVDAPGLIASTPTDGAKTIPTATPLRFLFNESLGLATAEDAVRLRYNGDLVAGKMTLSGAAIDFQPTRALVADADYTIELAGVADAAGNTMAPWTATFHTAEDSTPPAGFLALVSSTFDAGNPAPAPQDTLEFHFNRSLRAGNTGAGASITVPLQFNSAVYPVPFRLEVADDTVRLLPVLPWPSDRDVAVTLSVQDVWGSNYFGSFTLHAAPADNTRPEVVSIDPAPGSTLAFAQFITVRFSKAMLNATEANGGVLFTQGAFTLASGYWSDDRQTLVLPFLPAYSTEGYLTTPVSLVLSSHLTDLGGNALHTVTGAFPVGMVPAPASGTSALPAIARSWPERTGSGVLDPHAPISLLLSRPVDATLLNRGLWVVTDSGRVSGTWNVSSSGIFAAFTPDSPWPYSATVRLLPFQPTIDLTYDWSFSTPASPPAKITVRRSTLPTFGEVPANAAIEVEFDRDLPALPTPLSLQAAPTPYGTFQDILFEESAPSLRVRRLTPRAPLTVGMAVRVSLSGNDTFSAASAGTATVTAAVTGPVPALVARSPLPGAIFVPRNARASVRFSAALNPLSVNDATVKVAVGGRNVPVQLSTAGSTGVLTATPLDPLPANQTIDVTVQGLEDIQGRAIDRTSWTFQTGDAFDTLPPSLQYSNLPASAAGIDPTAVVTATYDEPLDAAADFLPLPQIGQHTVSFSPDLRTIVITPVPAWQRGLSTDLRASVPDWAGNINRADVTIMAGFDIDHSPLTVTTISPGDGTADVPINARLRILFNKPVGGGALANIHLLRDGKETALGSPKNSPENLLTLSPVFPLVPGVGYDLVLDAVQDLSGNVINSKQSVHFQTGEAYDVNAPVVVAHSFRPGQPARLRFNEVLDLATIAAPGGALLVWTNPEGITANEPMQTAWDAGNLELTLTPPHSLDPAVRYSFDLSRITDLAGNPVGSVSYAPDTPDAQPTAVSFSIPDGSRDVPLNASLQVRFSRAVTFPAGRLLEGDRVVARGVAGLSGTTTGTALLFNYPLLASTKYRLEIDSFTDPIENIIPAASSSFFTSTTPDVSQLDLISSVPANNDAGVSPLLPWQFTFNKPLAATSAVDLVPQASRPIPFRFASHVDGPILSTTATPAWPAAFTITWTLARSSRFGTAGITDWAGNTLSADLPFTVRTAAIDDTVAPVLESATPPAGTVFPTGNTVVTLRFSKPVMLPSSALQVHAGEETIIFNAALASDVQTVTLSFTAPANSRITVIGTNAIRDNADNPLAPFALEYSTADPKPTGRPTAKLVEPGSGAPPSTTTILVRFDRVMQQDPVVRSFRVTQDNENVIGGIDVLEDGRAYRFSPVAPFRSGATVRVLLLPTAVDLDGNSAYVSFPPFAQFTIASESNTLQLLSRGFGSNPPADSILEVQFDRELDLASVNDASVWLRRGRRLVTGKAMVRNGSVLQFLPDAFLEPGAEYVLTLGAALRSMAGSEFRGTDLRFRAAPLEQEPGLQSVEITEWLGAPAIRVSFNGPLSWLAAPGLRLEREGRMVPAEVVRAVSASEFWLMPAEWKDGADWTVVLQGVVMRNGRSLAPQRVPVPRQALR
jgi:hypothetical protein